MLTVVHQFEVAVVTLRSVRKVLPPSSDYAQNVSTNEFADPVRRNAFPFDSVATLTVHVGFEEVVVSWLS